MGEGAYELIAGERRWRAARRAGLQTIPALVRRPTMDSIEQALVENLHRQDLNPLEEGAAYQQLIEDFGLTHEQLHAGRQSRAAISNTLRLFQLPPSIQRQVMEAPFRRARPALLGTPDRAFQEALARRIVAGPLGQGGRGGGAGPQRARWSAAEPRTAPRGLRPPGILELEKLLSQHLGTRSGRHGSRRDACSSSSPTSRISSGSTGP